MKINPNLHILMPTYNVEQYIESSLFSIINQDYKNITTIIVDDGSSDFTKKILQKFLTSTHVSFEFFFASNNKGIASCREQLIGTSNRIDPNAYFLWLDADDKINDTHFISQLMKQMLSTKADICLYNFNVEFENESDLLKKNAKELIKDKLNSENILSYIVSTTNQLVSVDTYPQVATYTSLGWTKAYSPFIKNNWPKSETKYIYEDFAYMAALFLTDKITALPSDYKPIKYLRRDSSSTGKRMPEHFYIDVINQLLKFKENLGFLSFEKEKAAIEFINKKIQQYESTLKTLINSNTQGFSTTDLELFQKAKRLFE